MSKLVTFEQAKKLKELDFHNDVLHFYKDDGGLHELEYFDREWSFGVSMMLDDCNYHKGKYNAPTIHEALEWFRGVKGIECAVNLYQDDTIEDCIYYVGCYKDCDVIRRIGMRLTHSIAESALLDEVMKYVGGRV